MLTTSPSTPTNSWGRRVSIRTSVAVNSSKSLACLSRPRSARSASPYIQPIHYVRIVSDEDEGRATNIVVVLHPHADEEEAIAQERAPGCDRERQPLASSQTLLNRFTATDDGRI